VGTSTPDSPAPRPSSVSIGPVRRSQPLDAIQDAPKQLLRHGDLGHLEDQVAAVGDDLRSDLHDLLDE
jgi:hypothetical protein